MSMTSKGRGKTKTVGGTILTIVIALVVYFVQARTGSTPGGNGPAQTAPAKSAPTSNASSTSAQSPAKPAQQTAPAQPAAAQTKPAPKPPATQQSDDDGGIAELFKNEESDTWVEASGTVTRLLPDDKMGDQHQRWLMKTSSNVSVLFAHNIDIAPRVPLKEGDTIRFRGEYEWTTQGGTIHFTHKPKFSRKAPGGWIEHDGKRYE